MTKTKQELDEIKSGCIEAVNKLTELTEEELKYISGGVFYEKEFNKNKSDVKFVHKVGDIVEISTIFGFGTTVRCKITDTRIEWRQVSSSGGPGMPGSAYCYTGYVDQYYCQELESHWYFSNRWYERDSIEK